MATSEVWLDYEVRYSLGNSGYLDEMRPIKSANSTQHQE